MTVKRLARSSITGSHVVWSQPSPCSSSSAGPSPTFTKARRWLWIVRYWTSWGVLGTGPPRIARAASTEPEPAVHGCVGPLSRRFPLYVRAFMVS